MHGLCSNLRSAEAALELFASLKALRSGGALRQRMLSKSADIVLQFGREVDAMAALFEADKVRQHSPALSLACKAQDAPLARSAALLCRDRDEYQSLASRLEIQEGPQLSFSSMHEQLPLVHAGDSAAVALRGARVRRHSLDPLPVRPLQTDVRQAQGAGARCRAAACRPPGRAACPILLSLRPQ